MQRKIRVERRVFGIAERIEKKELNEMLDFVQHDDAAYLFGGLCCGGLSDM